MMWSRNNVFIIIFIIVTYNRVIAVKLKPIIVDRSEHDAFCMSMGILGDLVFTRSQIRNAAAETCTNLYERHKWRISRLFGPKHWSKSIPQKYTGELFIAPDGSDLYETPIKTPKTFRKQGDAKALVSRCLRQKIPRNVKILK
ncbi:hypothetical protein GcC1_021018 [Golovinomyces cichoracearum]|uniref:Uncharacterized protein n=1 Tax=Golovinomyces cichoracearum TaxID=62708 RepID=A0A420J4Y7_9PEZI|nr:hypothetical protein GcC1_021018 [Golovinomyces cichoracearum]